MEEMNLFGRRGIYTSYITPSMVKGNQRYNVLNSLEETLKVLNDSLIEHFENKKDIDYLFSYYRNSQPIKDRVKEIRPDVNNKIIVNYSQAVTRTIVGYTFGTPTVYKQVNNDKEKEINVLNDYNKSLSKASIDFELGTTASICGTSYAEIIPAMSSIGADEDIPYTIKCLNPANTYVVYYSGDEKTPVFAVNFFYSKSKNSNILNTALDVLNEINLTLYTRERIFIFKRNCGYGEIPTFTSEDLINVIDNDLLQELPIVEYKNNIFRLGDWESTISIFNAINSVVSDNVNDIQQFVSSILVLLNSELPKRTIKNTETGEDEEITDYDAVLSGILSLSSQVAGVNVDAKYISKQLDSSSVDLLLSYLDSAYKVVIGIPDRRTNSSGGDTGSAVTKRDGWEDLDIVAKTKDIEFQKSEKTTLKIILRILNITNNGLNIKPKDIVISCNRNKSSNLLEKANAISLLNSTKLFDARDIVNLAQITTDENSMVKRGVEYQEELLKENIKKAEELAKSGLNPDLTPIQTQSDNNNSIDNRLKQN